MNRLFLSTFLSVVFFSIPLLSHAASQPDVRILDVNGNLIKSLTPFKDPNTLIGSIASTDLGTDGTSEILIGAGEDADPSVSIFRQDGSLITSFLAYDVGYRGGVNVAACDVDGDGHTEIVTGAAWNGGPQVQIFDALGKKKYAGFFAFNEAVHSGITVACGDVTGDGIGDIIVGASVGGGPHIIIFSPTGKKLTETFLGSALSNTGVDITLADIDHNGIKEILATSMIYQTPTVTSFSFNATSSSLIATSSVVDTTHTDLLIAPFALDSSVGYITKGYATPSVVLLDTKGNITKTISPYSKDSLDALSATPVLKDSKVVGIIVANVAPRLNNDVSEKSIKVDISQQRLTAYEKGIPVYTFLVSTAKPGYVTPLGKTSVLAKLPFHDYISYFGPNDSRNYSLKGVKNNLRIYAHYYIHYAWWHNNFGRPVSHGCINVNSENSDWIFAWANVGTPVNVVR